MTAAQRATLEQMAHYADACATHAALRGNEGYRVWHQVRADALRAALGTCGSCEHANVDDAPDGSAYCTARMDDAHPFAYRRMPLDERCKGWEQREDADA